MEEYKDITKIGPIGLRGLSGIQNQNEQPSKWQQLSNILNQSKAKKIKFTSLFPTEASTEVGELVFNSGYGDSKYDENIQTVSQLQHIQDVRADSQPWYLKIGNGLAKMGVLAGTTFTDSIGGSVVGLINLAKEGINGNIDSGAEALNAFVQNPFSQQLQKINKWSEEIFPNYYSEEEQSSPWYENIFTANFVGDKFLKNLGFTIGAFAGAAATTSAASKLFLKRGMRDAFKGAVVTADGRTLNSASSIYRAYKSGDAFMDGAKLTKDLANSAKQLKNAETKLKLLGAFTGAVGEARIEAISGVDEWSEAQYASANELYRNRVGGIKQQMLDETPHYFYKVIQPDGTVSYELTEQGKLIYEEKVAEEKAKHEELLASINKKKVDVGNSIFGLNVALLTTSNFLQWGRALSGGYTSHRIAKDLVKGSSKEGYKVSGKAIAKERARAVAIPFIEGFEEMAQASAQEASGMWKSRELNNEFGEFYGKKIDPDAESEVASWLSSVREGFATTFSDINKYEEGFIGFLTGLLGVPTIRTNSKGKKRLGLNNEMWESFKDASQIKKEAEEIVAALNKNINSPEFLNYYQGIIRHQSLEEDKNRALDRGDKFEFLNSDHKQLVSDAIMYDKAGKIDELYSIIDQAANIREEDVATLREQTTDKNTGKSIYDDKTDEQIVQYIQSKASEIKGTVDRYIKISSDLKSLYGKNISQDVLEELTWGMTQVDDWEGRTKELIEDIREPLRDKVEELNNRFGIDMEIFLDNLDDFSDAFNEDYSLLDDIVSTINDKNLTIQEQRDKIDGLIKQKQKERNDTHLKLGRDINIVRKKFNGLYKKLEAQREKRKASLPELQEKKEKTENILSDKTESLKEKEELQNKINSYKKELFILKSKIDRENKKKKSTTSLYHFKNQKQHGKISSVLESLIPEVEKLDKLITSYPGSIEEIKATLSKINTELQRAELFMNADTVLDFETEEKYTPGTSKIRKPKVKKDVNGNVVYETRSVERNGRTVQEIVYEDEITSEESLRTRAKKKSDDLFSQIVLLKEMLNSEDNTLVNPLDVKKLNENLSDLVKLIAVRSKFLNTYHQLSKNPGLFTDVFQKNIEKALQAHEDKEVKRILVELESAKTVQEVREILEDENNNSYAESVINEVKRSKNKELKKLVSEYDDIKESIKILFGNDFHHKGGDVVKGILGDLDRSNNTVELLRDITDIVYNAESLKELQTNLEDKVKEYKADPTTQSLGETLEEVVEKYKNLIESSSTNKSDTESKKKIKKQKKKDDEEGEREGDKNFDRDNFFDDDDLNDDEDEIEESEEENDEDSEESEDGVSDESIDEETEEEIEEEYGDAIDLVQELNKKDIKELNEVLDNIDKLIEEEKFSINGEIVTKDQKNHLISIIKKIISRKEGYNIRGGDYDGKSANGDQFESYNSRAHRSWIETEYDINEAKSRKAVIRESDLVSELQKLGAYDFVNKGKLGLLYMEDENTVIHYITVEEGPLSGKIILAVEVNDAVRKLGTEGTTIKPNNSDKEYQAVGVLGFNQREMKSVNNYNAINDSIYEEREDLNTGTGSSYVVSEKFKNSVEHFYSGRMVTSSKDYNKEQRSLKDVIGNETPKFGVYYNDSRFEAEEDLPVVPLNKNNNNPREGSLWLLTLGADGQYYCKAVKIKRFTDEEYNIEENEDKPIMRHIIGAVTIIADPSKLDIERASAKLSLKEYLYFPEEAEILFNNDTVTIKDENNNTIYTANMSEASLEENVLDILKALQNEKLNLRFQVDAYKVAKAPNSNRDYIDDLLESDIITTDIAPGFLHNINASFDLPLLDPETGAKLSEKTTPKRGHTGRLGVNNAVTTDTVYINGSEYRKYDNGDIKNEKGQKISNPLIKAAIELQIQINKQEINPVEGSTSLYVGILQGNKFGLVNGHIKQGKDLEKLLEEAKNKAEKTKRNIQINEDKETNDEIGDLLDNAPGISKEELNNLFGESSDSNELEEGIIEEDEVYEEESVDNIENEKPSTENNPMEGSPISSSDEYTGEGQTASEMRERGTNTFTGLVMANRGKLTHQGKKVNLKEWIRLFEDSGGNKDTITSQEDMDAAIDRVNCHH